MVTASRKVVESDHRRWGLAVQTVKILQVNPERSLFIPPSPLIVHYFGTGHEMD